MEIEEAPRSTTRAEDLPAAKLEKVSCGVSTDKDRAHEVRTPLRASQYAGEPQLSIAISMPRSLSFPAFQPVSVMSIGLSLNGFSCSSTPSIFTSSFSVSFKPLLASGLGFAFVSRDVIAYSHKFAAVSQSSTVPSFDMTFLIEILGNGVCIELSPKRILLLESVGKTP